MRWPASSTMFMRAAPNDNGPINIGLGGIDLGSVGPGDIGPDYL